MRAGKAFAGTLQETGDGLVGPDLLRERTVSEQHRCFQAIKLAVRKAAVFSEAAEPLLEEVAAPFVRPNSSRPLRTDSSPDSLGRTQRSRHG